MVPVTRGHAWISLISLATAAGDLHGVERYARQLLAGTEGTSLTLTRGWAQFALGWVALEWSDFTPPDAG